MSILRRWRPPRTTLIVCQQFDYIAVQRAALRAIGLPILSTDTKKNELVGNFKNAG
jgi:hypothetical protein